MKTKHIILHLIIGFVLILNHQTQAQRRTVVHLPKFDLDPYHFGFILAGNQMMLTWKPVDNYQDILWTGSIDVKDITIPDAVYYRINQIYTDRNDFGFNVGIVGNLRLTNYFDLRFIPTLTFGERSLNYDISALRVDTTEIIRITQTKVMPSTLVEFPLILKYRSKRLNNFAAYILVGAKPTIEMVSRRAIENKNQGTSSEIVILDVKRSDIFYDIGTGFDFYTPYFKFGVELKMGYGATNILRKDQGFNDHIYGKSLEYIRNKVFQLSFTFE